MDGRWAMGQAAGQDAHNRTTVRLYWVFVAVYDRLCSLKLVDLYATILLALLHSGGGAYGTGATAMGPGIDYGLGMANVDHATGIRYGAISQHSVGQAWYDAAEPDYGEPTCPDCGSALVKPTDAHE